MPTNAYRRHPIDTGGPWGSGLLLFGVGAIMQGIGYLTRSENRLPEGLARFGDTIPIRFWAVLWILAGAYAAFKALRPPQRHADVWPLVGITMVWACAYVVFWFIGGCTHGRWSDSAWQSGIAWGSISAVLVCWGRCVNPPRVP